MLSVLIWIYVINLLLLINHEIDSAYWKEWNLFNSLLKNKPPYLTGKEEQKAMNNFLVFNIIAIGLGLYGLVELIEGNFIGKIFSLLTGLVGIAAFMIHMFFIAKGRSEFKVPFSLFVLFTILIASLAQIVVTILVMTE